MLSLCPMLRVLPLTASGFRPSRALAPRNRGMLARGHWRGR
jgi:hypothetical protein